MKAQELRIGNLVSYSEETRRVTQVSENLVWLQTKGCEKASVLAAIEEINTIELTNGWLISLEFETDEILYYNSKLAIGSFKDGYYYTPSGLSGRRGIKIEYVHQLQNLYFALTGKELELNENL